MDQWITMNPEAGADFDAPAREVILRSDGGADADGGTGDDGGTVTNDAPTSDVDIELLEPRAATGLTRTIAR